MQQVRSVTMHALTLGVEFIKRVAANVRPLIDEVNSNASFSQHSGDGGPCKASTNNQHCHAELPTARSSCS